jgi:hypothetical protein
MNPTLAERKRKPAEMRFQGHASRLRFVLYPLEGR